VAWTSPDGRHWSAANATFPHAPLPTTHIAVHGDQLVFYDATLTAAGGTFWSSPDGGKTWQQVKVPGIRGSFATTYNGVTDGPGGFYVYGNAATLSAGTTVFLLASPDGAHWSLAANAPAPPGGFGGFTSLITVGSGFAAVGLGTGKQTLYRSSDGKRWQPSGTLTAASTYGPSLAAAGGSVIFAASGSNAHAPPAFSVANPTPASVNLGAIPDAMPTARAADSVAVSGGQTVVVGAANGAPAAWYSQGNSWRRAALPAATAT
jgi:hypothetical protein